MSLREGRGTADQLQIPELQSYPPLARQAASRGHTLALLLGHELAEQVTVETTRQSILPRTAGIINFACTSTWVGQRSSRTCFTKPSSSLRGCASSGLLCDRLDTLHAFRSVIWNSASRSKTAVRFREGLTSFCDLLQHPVVERQVGHDLLQPPGLLGLHAAVLVPPTIERRLAEL